MDALWQLAQTAWYDVQLILAGLWQIGTADWASALAVLVLVYVGAWAYQEARR